METRNNRVSFDQVVPMLVYGRGRVLRYRGHVFTDAGAFPAFPAAGSEHRK